MTKDEMDKHILGEFKYLRERLDRYMDDNSDHRICVQKQLADIKILVTKRTTENRVRIAGITTLISTFVSACVAATMVWLSTKVR